MRNVLVPFVAVVALAGCKRAEQPADAGAGNTPNPPGDDLSKVEPAFRFTVEEFCKEWKADEHAAAAKYGGKAIELSGEVERVGRTNEGEGYVVLKVGGQRFGETFLTADRQPWARVVKGQSVKIKGRCPTTSDGLGVLVGCVFVETGEYLGVRVTAPGLAKELAAEPGPTCEKYEGKYLVVTGEVASKELTSGGVPVLGLRTDNKVKVACTFVAFHKDITTPFKIGQKITVVGEFSSSFSADEARIIFCLPLDGP